MAFLGLALAVLIGLSLGLLGGGGSILTVPIFVYVLGFGAKEAIAMSLAVVGAVSLFGAAGHWRAGNVNLRVAVVFGGVAMAGTYLGARLAVFFSGTAQLALFAAVMLLAAFFMFREKKPAPAADERLAERGDEDALADAAALPGGAFVEPMPLALIIVEGLAVGVLTGLVGVGGGFLIVPALVLLARIPMKQAVGTSLLVIAMKSASGFVGYLGQVEVPWGFMTLFTVVAMAGIVAGTYLVQFVSQAALKRAFAVFLMVMGGFILYQNRAALLPDATAAAGPASRAASAVGVDDGPTIAGGVTLVGPASAAAELGQPDCDRGDPTEGAMILTRFYDDKLAQASYLVGCAATGEALVVDPNRDAEQFVSAAEAEGLRIAHVTETHIHADFVSGAREVAARTGAKLYLSDEGTEEWKYAFARDCDAVLLEDGDRFDVGSVRIDVRHTPGHTPEHLSFVVTDTAGADRPMGVFTGDFIFVGDVGRPDLLERAAQLPGTMERAAKALYASLQKFKAALPDFVQLWPGHGAGSACGKALGAVPQTTLGYEKLFNWGLAAAAEAEFVRAVLAGQPEPPMYFAEMKRINQEGPRVLDGFARPQRLPEPRLEAVLAQDATVVDTRPAGAFAAGHVPGTLNVPLGRSFTTWAGSVLPYDREFYLIVEDASGSVLDEVVRDLALIGLDRVAGCFEASIVRRWMRDNRAVEDVPEVSGQQLQSLLDSGGAEVIDVRNGSEWQAGHIPSSRNHPLGRLAESLERIPRDRPLVVHCQSGARAAVAISVLQASGVPQVSHLTGDFGGWVDQGRPVETAAPTAQAAG